MDEKTMAEIDDSFRVLTVGECILDEAEVNPSFRQWLAAFLDARIDDRDRRLFDFLPEARGENILPFPVRMVPPGED